MGIDPLNNPELVEVFCDECGESPLLVPVDEFNSYHWCEECADDAD